MERKGVQTAGYEGVKQASRLSSRAYQKDHLVDGSECHHAKGERRALCEARNVLGDITARTHVPGYSKQGRSTQ